MRVTLTNIISAATSYLSSAVTSARCGKNRLVELGRHIWFLGRRGRHGGPEARAATCRGPPGRMDLLQGDRLLLCECHTLVVFGIGGHP